MPLDPGTKIGEFSVIREIGRGAMGEVYLAEQTSLRRNVALKVLHPSFSADPSLLERFRREALNAARLRHGAIVPVIAAGDHQGTLFIAMDYIEGRSLDRILREMQERGTLPGPELIASLLRIVVEIGESLHYAHEEGMLHRDIKPSNILLDKRGRPYLGDFGLARHRFDSPLTISGDLIGTPRYMAPEVLDGKIGPVDRRVDIYSLGATLYELVTLHPPFDGQGLQELFSRINSGISDPASKRNPAVPEELSDALDRALAKNPEERFRDAHEFFEALREILQGSLCAFTSDSNFAALMGSMRSSNVETPKPQTPPKAPTPPKLPIHALQHTSSSWVSRVSGGSKLVSFICVLIAYSWITNLRHSRNLPPELIFGAYPFAFLALVSSTPWRAPKGSRTILWILWICSFSLCAWIFSGKNLGILDYVPAFFMIAAHIFYDRWIHEGKKNLLWVPLAPYVLAVVLYACTSPVPLTVGILNFFGPIAVFSATSILVVIPEYFWPDLVRDLNDALRRATLVGLPAAAIYFLLRTAL